MQWVCHVEIQGLYAEAALRAGLVAEGRPVVIVRDGRVFDGGRSAFVSGLILGSPFRQIQRDVPGAAVIEYGQVEYASLARQWWDGCLKHTPYLEPISPHQAVLSLPFPREELGEEVRKEVQQLCTLAEKIGFIGFAGVGSNKLIAQAAARSCKEGWLAWRPGRKQANRPETTHFVPRGREADYLASLPIGYLPLPHDLARKVVRLGMQTIGDLERVSEGELVRQLGGFGSQVWHWCRGLDTEPVKPVYPPRRLMRRIAFQSEMPGVEGLERPLLRLAATMGRELESKGDGCQQVGLTLERLHGEPFNFTRVLPRLICKAFPLQRALLEMLSQIKSDVTVSSLTIELGLIGQMGLQQMALWDDRLRDDRAVRIEKAIDLLRERFPVRSVRLGDDGGCTWREQMLTFHDPYRSRRSTRGAG